VSREQAHSAVLGLVTRRPQRRPLPTGLLSATSTGFEFAYVQAFGADPEQRPLLGFSDPMRSYRSPVLFPFFQQRIPEADRSDRAAFLHWLGLPEDATDWQVLARGGGTRKGDRFELVAAPERTPAGGATARVLARGLRFMGEEVGFDRLAEGLARLSQGMPLEVEVDATNVVNPAARRILSGDGTPLGWVPDVIVSYLAPRPSDLIHVRVAHLNGSDVPWHVRLLIDLEVAVHPSTPIFATTEWQPLAAPRPREVPAY
jgi:hypothetical protein